jgi:hypothetical protein
MKKIYHQKKSLNPRRQSLNNMNKKLKVPNPHILSFYAEEAEKCMKSRAYFAACVMLASLLEYVLIIAYDALPVSSSKNKASKRPDLFSLINIAQEEGWIGKNKLNEHVDTIRLVRNLVHTDKLVEYFDNNKEPPVFDIETSKALASSISEVLKSLKKVLIGTELPKL